MKKTLNDWLDYIAGLHPAEIDLSLDRMHAIVETLGLKKISCPVITVAGTNGKGSCVKILESIYSHQKYRTGAYTSPDLLRFNERIRIDGQEICDKELITAFEEINHVRNNKSLTFFEFTTLAALLIFAQQNLDVLILEVGLGGRLDAVNIIDADLAIIATIGIDHTDRLGPDRDSIGREKAGIFRSKRPVVCGDPNPPASILEIAQNLECPMHIFGRDFFYKINEDTWTLFHNNKELLNLPLPELPLQNAATSLTAIELLQSLLPVSKTAIINGLQSAFLPGRFEVIHEPTLCIFDVAHNPHAAVWLAEQLRSRHPKQQTYAVVGMLKDKLIAETLLPLINLIDQWFVAGLTGLRGHDGSLITQYLQANTKKNWYTFASVAEAFSAAIAASKDEEVRILIFGSFHTVAEAKCHLSDKSSGGVSNMAVSC